MKEEGGCYNIDKQTDGCMYGWKNGPADRQIGSQTQTYMYRQKIVWYAWKQWQKVVFGVKGCFR